MTYSATSPPRYGPRSGHDHVPNVETSPALHRVAAFPVDAPNTTHAVRALVTATLTDWRLLFLADDVLLCASELVGNVMRHAVGPVRSPMAGRWVTVGLCLENAAAVRVEVEDDDPRLPQPCADPDELATQGRGLWIIEQLADRLWWERSWYGGKTVCCRFDLIRYPGHGEPSPNGRRRPPERGSGDAAGTCFRGRAGIRTMSADPPDALTPRHAPSAPPY